MNFSGLLLPSKSSLWSLLASEATINSSAEPSWPIRESAFWKLKFLKWESRIPWVRPCSNIRPGLCRKVGRPRRRRQWWRRGESQHFGRRCWLGSAAAWVRGSRPSSSCRTLINTWTGAEEEINLLDPYPCMISPSSFGLGSWPRARRTRSSSATPRSWSVVSLVKSSKAATHS